MNHALQAVMSDQEVFCAPSAPVFCVMNGKEKQEITASLSAVKSLRDELE